MAGNVKEGALDWQAKSILPVTRALRYCAARGWPAGRVDRRVGRLDHDFMGCFDIAACEPLGPTGRILLIQVTSGKNHATRVAKVKALSAAWAPFARAGAVAEVWSFGLRGRRGQPKEWTLRREVVDP